MPRQQRILRRKRLLICNTGNKAKMHIHIAVGGLPRVHTAISISYDRMCIQTIAKKGKSNCHQDPNRIFPEQTFPFVHLPIWMLL